MKKKSYAQETADRLRKERNFATADVNVDDVIQIIEDDEDYINELKKEKNLLKKKLKEVKKSFNSFAADYEFHVIECADTREQGREELEDNKKWQALKRLISEE